MSRGSGPAADRIKALSVVGARPQFVKASVVSRAIERYNQFQPGQYVDDIIVHTGQHYDYLMSQVFFDQLNIPAPRHHLGVRCERHGEMTACMLLGLEPLLISEEPDFLMVYGDTNSTLAGALAAAKLHIPVIHVESGLRSFNRCMPEEINRVVTDHLSSMLFCPTDVAVGHLREEGIEKDVFQVGDVMYDSFLFCRDLAAQQSRVLADLSLSPGEYYLATVHRAENTDDPARIKGISDALRRLGELDCPVVFPLHPRTAKATKLYREEQKRGGQVRVVAPLSYFDMVALESQARLIITDSGGVQKEAYFSRVPCVTLRDETEWTETIEAGWNHLGGTNTEQIVSVCKQAASSVPTDHPPFYGDGRSGDAIVECLAQRFCSFSTGKQAQMAVSSGH